MTRKRRNNDSGMNKTTIHIAILALTALILSPVQAANNHVWLKQSVEWNFLSIDDSNTLCVKVEPEEKFDEHRFYLSETLAMFGWKLKPYFGMCIGNRWAYERSGGKGKLRAEQRPTLDLCLAFPEFYTLKFDFRSRFEYRDKHGSKAYMRYRERLRLRTSWNVTDFRISPYASEEMFFSDKPGYETRDVFDRSRAQLGVSFRPVPSWEGVSCNLYYMVQHDLSSRSWTPTNVYGLELSWSF